MAHTIEQIAAALGAQAFGAVDVLITGAAEPAMAGPGDLALAMAPKYAEGLAVGSAQAAILWEGADWKALGLKAALVVPRPRLAMAHLTQLLDPGPRIAPGVHPSAVVDPSAQIGAGAAIGPFVVIAADVVIGANARIASHVSIEHGTHIGVDAMIMAGTRIGHQVKIGDRFIAQPNAVIGGDGFSFVTPQTSGMERARHTLGDQGETLDQSWTRIHSLGAVRIGDDVELGANTCVDRGTIRDTFVGDGCKIDNLCQVAHNVVMGCDCLMAGQSGIAGSTVLGDRVVVGGSSALADNITVGNDVIFGGGSKVASNVPAGRVMMGYPAVRMEQHVEMYKAARRLPRLLRQLSAEKAVSKPDQSD